MSPDSSQFVCRELTNHQIQIQARELLIKNLGSAAPPIDVDYLIDLEGLIVEPVSSSILLDVDAALLTNWTTIVVNQDKYMSRDQNWKRTRFSLSHELGHYVLHKYLQPIFSSFTDIDHKHFLHFNQSIDYIQYGYFEEQADYFAGNLLVDREFLIRNSVDILNSAEVNQAQRSAIPNLSPWQAMDYISPLRTALIDIFEVNPACIKKRLSQDNNWTEILSQINRA